jgi:hypothetical protein
MSRSAPLGAGGPQRDARRMTHARTSKKEVALGVTVNAIGLAAFWGGLTAWARWCERHKRPA